MRYLFIIINWIMDHLLAWFSPGWRRKACEAQIALNRYYNYNKPHLTEELNSKLLNLRKKLNDGLIFWKKEECIQTTAEITSLGEGLRGFKKNAAFEMVESLFVIMVIFLGIRTYYAQPFRIPTGSMQPSLNGIIIHPIPENEPMPSAAQRVWDAITLGSSYTEVIADVPKKIVRYQDERYLHLFTRTRLFFSDGSQETVPCGVGAVVDYLHRHNKLNRTLAAGEVIIRGRIDAGDMIIVNRMAYHFRSPQRGETFVFDTRGINTAIPEAMPDQSKASNYIKRLCGLPGDTLTIEEPRLIVNGSPATEPGICRVANREAPFNSTGYNAISRHRDPNIFYHSSSNILPEGQSISLRKHDDDNPNLNEFYALGDNTVNSKDSRYWGPVHQFNVLGPACFALWPFTEHWGTID